MNAFWPPLPKKYLLYLAIASTVAACDSASPIPVVYGGQHLAVPRNYFPPWALPKHKVEPGSLILRTYWPKYSATPTLRVSPERWGGHADKIMVLLSKQPKSLQPSYAVVASLRMETRPFHDAHGLRAFYSIAPTSAGESAHRKVYFSHRDQVVETLIICEPWHHSPPCDHVFNAVGFGFRITYSMDHLHDWRSIQSRVASLVAGFVEGPHDP